MSVSIVSYSQKANPIHFRTVEKMDAEGQVWVDHSVYTVELVTNNTLNISKGVEYAQYSIIEPSIEIKYYGDIEYIQAEVINVQNYNRGMVVIAKGIFVLVEQGETYTFYNKQ